MNSTLQAANYAPLERRNLRNENCETDIDIGPPKDRKHMVYISLLTAGIGFVLPYNSFVIATDYWQQRFPGKYVALDISLTYIIVAFITVLLNNVLLSLATLHTRVTFGYIVSFSTLIFVALCEVAYHTFETSNEYAINLLAVSFVAIGCTIQQSSFYGFASMLPKQYTQAVMSGESLAGFLVSSNRVLTKLIIDNDRVSTVLFFLTSTVYIAFSYGLYSITKHSPFIRYYTKKCSKIVLRPDEDMSPDRQKEYNSTNSKYGVLNFDASSSRTPKSNTSTQALSFSNPVYELSNPTAGESILDDLNNLSDAPQTPSQEASTSVSFKVEHVLTPGPGTSGKLSDFKSGFESRKKVSELIYPYMVSIALAYCVTLSLYPGIESEIVSCTYRTWMPVLLMFAFNLSDLIGKLLAVIPYNWSRRQLILMSGLRVVLIPLLLLCAAPRNRPVIAGEFAAFIFTIALGITNGLAGSLPMMLAPLKVPAILREVTGNMMTLSYNVGLTAGSLIGYVFESMLGSGTSLEESCKSPYDTFNSNKEIVKNASNTTFSIIPVITTEEPSNSTILSTLLSTMSTANSIFSSTFSTIDNRRESLTTYTTIDEALNG